MAAFIFSSLKSKAQSPRLKTANGTVWWGEAADEPERAHPNLMMTAREDHRRAGQAARPTE
jgi:hypothetical protein